MPSSSQHIDKADRDADFAYELDQNTESNREWAVIAFFYAALHYIEAYFAARHDLHHMNHWGRDKAIGLDGQLEPIWSPYRELKDAANAARYDVSVCTSDEVQAAAELYEGVKGRIHDLLL